MACIRFLNPSPGRSSTPPYRGERHEFAGVCASRAAARGETVARPPARPHGSGAPRRRRACDSDDVLEPRLRCGSVEEPAIRVEGLVKRYGAHEAVRGISFAVAPGEVFG